MNKRLLSLLLLLALLLCAATGLCEQTPNLTTAKITALRQLVRRGMRTCGLLRT